MVQEAIKLNVGEVRGNREFLGYFGKNEKGRSLVKVRCLNCGSEKIITKCTFTRNVGCRECKQKEINENLRKMRTTHGLSKNKGHRPLYDIYMGIIGRCNNPNNHAYENYGGRGIKCEWKNVEEFVRDMGEGYKKGLSIDRIDVNGNYCKENCRRATQEEQQNNRRDNNYIEIYGIKYNSKQFAEKYNVSKATASHRICGYLHGRYTLDQITKQGTKYKKDMEIYVDGKIYRSMDLVNILGCHRSTAIRLIHKYNDGKITKDQLFKSK